MNNEDLMLVEYVIRNRLRLELIAITLQPLLTPGEMIIKKLFKLYSFRKEDYSKFIKKILITSIYKILEENNKSRIFLLSELRKRLLLQIIIPSVNDELLHIIVNNLASLLNFNNFINNLKNYDSGDFYKISNYYFTDTLEKLIKC
jgi:wyosine [tRNA(Phe)-imidazoG37] synthetase (radical SAM superfamily)